MGVCGPNLIHNSLGPSKPTNRTASRSVQPFLHSSRHSVPIFYNGPPLPPPNWPFSWGSGPNLMHGSLGSPKSSTQTASCLVELFLQDRAHYCDKQTDRQTDRPTDHATRSVTVGRINVQYVVLRRGLIMLLRSSVSRSWTAVTNSELGLNATSKHFAINLRAF